MSYLVFARRFRPQTFSCIIGQEHISEALANSIVSGRIPHAVLFTGPRGVGKTTSARVFAKALNCTGHGALPALAELLPAEARAKVEPCNECTNCSEISRSVSLAVREIDGASNNSVENVRELIESLRSLPPPGSRYKVYVIDEVHMLSTSAFNALLKSLEEPPPNTVFIFATTDPQKIPETVLSRCQRYDFQRLPQEQIVAQLRAIAASENMPVDEDVLRLIARKANGGMRDALSMFDRLLAYSAEHVTLDFAQKLFGIVDSALLSDLAWAIVEHSAERCFAVVDAVFKQSVDLRSFVADFVCYWRNLLLVALNPKAELADLTAQEKSELSEIIKGQSVFDIQRLFDLARENSDLALTSQFPRFVLEAGLAKMASLSSLRPLGEILRILEGGEAPTNTAVSVKSAPQAALPPPTAGAFNPSWHNFVVHVKNCSEHVLAAFLRRVTPRVFAEGVLELGGATFDIAALQEAETLADLRRCLASYSARKEWRITFSVSAAPAADSSNVVPESSIVAQEELAERDRRKQIDSEARNDPAVKAALMTFSGSKIDKVSLLKER
jgi:DNA polymerase III subunit gamma/tau